MSSLQAEQGLHSLGVGLEALEQLAAAPDLGVSELARRLGVAKSTAHRILTTLTLHQLVERSADGQRYRLGQRLHELGEVVAMRNSLREQSLPLLEELRDVTGETVHIAVPSGGEVFYVERLESYQGLRFSSRVGRRMPVHCTSSGKAIAAFNPEVARVACELGFPSRTGRTIRDQSQFVRCLAETRRRGYAFSIEEAERGLSSVAAPVLDREGVARAAISVAGPTVRVIGDDIAPLAYRVLEAARRLQAQEVVWWTGSAYR